jgi:hypothetical protein
VLINIFLNDTPSKKHISEYYPILLNEIKVNHLPKFQLYKLNNYENIKVSIIDKSNKMFIFAA